MGLFQQRPSQGWGTTAQILDPVYATTAFYAALERIPGWQAMTVTVAAQAVQHSAAPDAYAQWETEGRSLAVALTGEAAAAQTELGRGIGGSFNDKAGWQVAGWLVGHAWQYHIRKVTFGGATWTSATGKWSRATGIAAGPIGFS